MPTAEQRTQDRKQRSQLAYLLIALIFNLLVVPLAGYGSSSRWLLGCAMTAVLVTAAIATERRRSLLVLSLVGAAIVAPVIWTTLFYDYPMMFLMNSLLAGMFFVAMAMLILTSVIRKHLATLDSIFGAISAYLLLGLSWAVVYWGIDRVHPHAFYVDQQAEPYLTMTAEGNQIRAFSQFVYFSFVTMSTLGYGDIRPQTPIAQTITWMQSVVGQFYIAVLVAWLVSEIPSRKQVTP